MTRFGLFTAISIIALVAAGCAGAPGARDSMAPDDGPGKMTTPDPGKTSKSQADKGGNQAQDDEWRKVAEEAKLAVTATPENAFQKR